MMGVSCVGLVAWNCQSRSDDQQTHDTAEKLVAHSGTHPRHYAPSSRTNGRPLVRLSTRTYRRRSAMRGLQKSHTGLDFFDESVAMLRLGVAEMDRPSRVSSLSLGD